MTDHKLDTSLDTSLDSSLDTSLSETEIRYLKQSVYILKHGDCRAAIEFRNEKNFDWLCDTCVITRNSTEVVKGGRCSADGFLKQEATEYLKMFSDEDLLEYLL